MSQPYYQIQPAFTGGEVSGDVASRVDIDKYQLSLLQAENMIISPYGSAKKRTGSKYCGETQSGQPAILLPFEFTAELSYMLEFTAGHLRVWRGGNLLPIDLSTPFGQTELRNIRTVQSVDVMYICTGTHPVYKLSRYSESDWRLEPVSWTLPPFSDINADENTTIAPSGIEGTVSLTANADIFTADDVDSFMRIDQRVTGRHVEKDLTTSASFDSGFIGAGGSSEFTFTISTTNASSADSFSIIGDMFFNSGPGEVTVTLGTISAKSPTFTTKATANTEYFEITSNGGVTSSATITVSIDGKQEYVFTVDPGTTQTATINVFESWKFVTHGTWTGTVRLQQSFDGGTTWLEYRSYTSNDDFNPSETGTVDEDCILRITAAITKGTCKADLSTYPSNRSGYVKITGYTDSKHVQAKVVKKLGAATATADFYRSAWGGSKGYPYTVTFFQDRLVLGGSPKYPQRVWMSRTGDYENFEVEKESGTVTDDSAVTADLLSLKSYQINHLIASNDLLVMTEGNTWTISGNETVTPSNISPRNQENYGTNHVEPIKVGTRYVYVQRRGSTVRDVGYTYDSDSYVGVDLTLLAKHLVNGYELTDAAYTQEPDQCLYFVRSDGALLRLTYVPEQKVFAWSHFTTNGKYESVCAIKEAHRDVLYTVVLRNGRRCVEAFDALGTTACQQDYHMMDSYKTFTFNAATKELSGLSWLEGMQVSVLGDGYYYDADPLVVTGGKITLPDAVQSATVGLPYTMMMEQCNFDAGNTDTGTLQGRRKFVSTAILRLSNSYGGRIGPDSKALNKAIFYPDRMDLSNSKNEEILYTGDKEVVLGKGGYNNYGRTYIVQDEPYPFTISAIIREVTLR